MIYKDEVGYDVGDVSEDGRWIAFAKSRTTSDSDISLWDAAKKTVTVISTHKGQASYRPAEFDPESRSLYYLTDDGGEFMRVKKYDLASGATRTSSGPTGTSGPPSSRTTASTG